jgi:hypothetical protein
VGEDRSADVRRTTVAEAAEILGISAESVRGRIRRGTLPVEREGGTFYVLVDQREDHRTTGDQSSTTTGQPSDRTELLIAEMQDRIRSLEEADRENRRIIAALTSRIPAIEAPSSEPPVGPDSGAEAASLGPSLPLPRGLEPGRRAQSARGGGGSLGDERGGCRKRSR